MDKSVWEVVGVPEIYNWDSRGKTILNLCAGIFSAISEPNHAHHQKHREYTHHTLNSILMMLTVDTVYDLSQEYEWETEDGEQAISILDNFITKKAHDLEKIVYRPVSRGRRKSSRQRSVFEDWKCACILGAIFDFEVEAEIHVEEVMETVVHQLPRP